MITRTPAGDLHVDTDPQAGGTICQTDGFGLKLYAVKEVPELGLVPSEEVLTTADGPKVFIRFHSTRSVDAFMLALQIVRERHARREFNEHRDFGGSEGECD